MADDLERARFWRLAGAGISFQGGSAAVDSATIIAGFVHALTGSSVAVGIASASLRFGWLFPQLFIGYLAQRSARRMPFYIVGALGRAACLAANDIVGRSIPSHRRSRMLAWRFFGGGLLGVIVAAAYRLLNEIPFPQGHGAIFGLAAILMFVSSVLFVSAGEPTVAAASEHQRAFLDFLGEGLRVYREDGRFRLFLYSQWLGGATLGLARFH